MIDRVEASRELAKAIAFALVGNMEKAQHWTGLLIQRLQNAGMVPR